jgi:hypothetical protein
MATREIDHDRSVLERVQRWSVSNLLNAKPQQQQQQKNKLAFFSYRYMLTLSVGAGSAGDGCAQHLMTSYFFSIFFVKEIQKYRFFFCSPPH